LYLPVACSVDSTLLESIQSFKRNTIVYWLHMTTTAGRRELQLALFRFWLRQLRWHFCKSSWIQLDVPFAHSLSSSDNTEAIQMCVQHQIIHAGMRETAGFSLYIVVSSLKSENLLAVHISWQSAVMVQLKVKIRFYGCVPEAETPMLLSHVNFFDSFVTATLTVPWPGLSLL
jgi:hypothetical protein